MIVKQIICIYYRKFPFLVAVAKKNTRRAIWLFYSSEQETESNGINLGCVQAWLRNDRLFLYRSNDKKASTNKIKKINYKSHFPSFFIQTERKNRSRKLNLKSLRN